jgi:D-alanyl-D-alanine carboxypeptidase/D-alanyl-D-alanine-endopeptidase (penicillin-binding protein 4)
VGDSVRVTTEPRTSFVHIENAGRTLPDTSLPTLDISRKWREFSNTITITGGVGIGDTVISTKLSIAQPAWYTLTVLREAFEASGVKIGGVMIDSVSARAREVARCSHRLDSVLVYMDRTSDNLAAENVLRTLAVHRQGAPGTASGGIAVVREFLAGIGIDTTKTVIADGSGVSRYNLTNAESIVDLLVALSKRPDLFPLWRQTFPIAGVSGTLARRMKNTPAAGNLRGKTGTLNGVSSLSGYVTTADGDMLAYAVIMEQFPGSPQPYRRVQDLLGALLAGWRR